MAINGTGTVPGDGVVQAGDYDPQRNGRRGSRITLLSLDGGGIRGIIPCKMLEYLESELQRLDGPDVRLMDYFDIAAGTSTGGLIAGLLNVLDSTTNRPRFSAKDATSFYVQNAAAVFPQPKGGCFGSLFSTMNNIFNPKYSNKGLEQVLKDTVGDLKLSQAFKEVVVSTFDVKLELPRFLSKVEATENALLDPLMREACLATSAAPTFLPAVNFQTTDASGNTLEYNCVDGTLVNNNPTYLAIAHAIRLIQKGSAFHQTSSFQGYSDFLVVSLGTGDDMASYQAQQVANWGLFSWIYKSGTVPLWDMVSAGGASMVDYNMAVFFEAQQCSENYLRIQLRSSTPVPAIDDSSASTIARLQEMADEILFAQEETWNLLEGHLVRQSRKRTNAEALRSMALELSKERKARAE